MWHSQESTVVWFLHIRKCRSYFLAFSCFFGTYFIRITFQLLGAFSPFLRGVLPPRLTWLTKKWQAEGKAHMDISLHHSLVRMIIYIIVDIKTLE